MARPASTSDLPAARRFYYKYIKNTRTHKLTINILLFITIIGCISLLVLLFIAPKIFRNDALIHPRPPESNPTLTPAVAIAILSTILAGATATIITRCVEESMWRGLAPQDPEVTSPKRLFSIGETRRLSFWSISAACRLSYIVDGESWALKFVGLCILALGVVSPVLLSGVSQKTVSEKYSGYRPRRMDLTAWWGFMGDPLLSNSNLYKHIPNLNPVDMRGDTAFLFSLAGASAPAAPPCKMDMPEKYNIHQRGYQSMDGERMDPSRCVRMARTAGFKTTCTSAQVDPQSQPTDEETGRKKFCSKIKEGPCVELGKDDSDTYESNIFASFTTGMEVSARRKAGKVTVIFGAYLGNWTSLDDGVKIGDLNFYEWNSPITTIDCRVSYGWVNITQNGTLTPEIVQDVFEIVPVDQLSILDSAFGEIYATPESPNSWKFQGGIRWDSARTEDNGEALLQSPVGRALLGWPQNRGGPEVASMIEKAWDMHNLLAFTGGYENEVVDLTTTFEQRETLFIYNKRVLFILLLPLAAILFGCTGRLWVGPDDLVLGYDPIKIARFGPVDGLPDCTGLSEKEVDNLVDKMKVGRYIDAEGKIRFAAFQKSSIPRKSKVVRVKGVENEDISLQEYEVVGLNSSAESEDQPRLPLYTGHS